MYICICIYIVRYLRIFKLSLNLIWSPVEYFFLFALFSSSTCQNSPMKQVLSHPFYNIKKEEKNQVLIMLYINSTEYYFLWGVLIQCWGLFLFISYLYVKLILNEKNFQLAWFFKSYLSHQEWSLECLIKSDYNNTLWGQYGKHSSNLIPISSYV